MSVLFKIKNRMKKWALQSDFGYEVFQRVRNTFVRIKSLQSDERYARWMYRTYTGKERCLIQSDNRNGPAVYVFTPSVFCLVPPSIKRHFSMCDRAKLMLRVLRGYTVYYQVSHEYRGRGLGGKLIEAAIVDKNEGWETVYAVVKEDNLPSIRTLEKLNFVRIGFSDKSGWSHKLTDKQTKLPVFCLTRSAQ